MDPTQSAAPAGMPPAAPSAPAAPAPGGDQGMTVCITSNPDGTFTVYAQGQDPSAGQQSSDVNDALDQAQQMLSGGSGAGGDASSTPQDADALFQGGFNKVRGQPGGQN